MLVKFPNPLASGSWGTWLGRCSPSPSSAWSSPLHRGSGQLHHHWPRQRHPRPLRAQPPTSKPHYIDTSGNPNTNILLFQTNKPEIQNWLHCIVATTDFKSTTLPATHCHVNTMLLCYKAQCKGQSNATHMPPAAHCAQYKASGRQSWRGGSSITWVSSMPQDCAPPHSRSISSPLLARTYNIARPRRKQIQIHILQPNQWYSNIHPLYVIHCRKISEMMTEQFQMFLCNWNCPL